MFNRQKSLNTDTSLEQIVSIIGPGAVIEGPFTAKDSTRVDGTINGNVTISGSLIIGFDGKINGTVSALNIYNAGEIHGNVTAGGKVEISDTGKIFGDIISKSLVIDENAVFQGQCTMTSDKSSAETAKERAVTPKE